MNAKEKSPEGVVVMALAAVFLGFCQSSVTLSPFASERNVSSRSKSSHNGATIRRWRTFPTIRAPITLSPFVRVQPLRSSRCPSVVRRRAQYARLRVNLASLPNEYLGANAAPRDSRACRRYSDIVEQFSGVDHLNAQYTSKAIFFGELCSGTRFLSMLQRT